MSRLRWWLVERIANGHMVVLNAHVLAPHAGMRPKAGKQGLVAYCYFAAHPEEESA
jgi:hypothetical protein